MPYSFYKRPQKLLPRRRAHRSLLLYIIGQAIGGGKLRGWRREQPRHLAGERGRAGPPMPSWPRRSSTGHPGPVTSRSRQEAVANVRQCQGDQGLHEAVALPWTVAEMIARRHQAMILIHIAGSTARKRRKRSLLNEAIDQAKQGRGSGVGLRLRQGRWRP